jgi:hypothetical protein
MTRYLFALHTDLHRDNAVKAVVAAPHGALVQVTDDKRTLPQNAKMWALLTDVAMQKTHCGRSYSTDQWKAIFMHAVGQEVQFIPSLDEKTFIPWGNRSSELSTAEMSALIEFIISWGTQNGVTFHDREASDAA